MRPMSEPATNRKAAFSVLAVGGLIVNTGLGVIVAFVLVLAMFEASPTERWQFAAAGVAVPMVLNGPILAVLALTRPGAAGAMGWLMGTVLGLATAAAVMFLMVSICA